MNQPCPPSTSTNLSPPNPKDKRTNPSSTNSSTTVLTLPVPVSSRELEKNEGRQNLESCRDYLFQDINPARATALLLSFCFMSGFINAVPFTAILVWCGFQTGNTVQLAVAIGKFFDPENRDMSFEMADKQALVSLLSYLVGGLLGRYGDRMGPTTRAWLSLGTFGQALLTMAAAITIWKSGEPSIAQTRGDDAWTNTLSFVSLAFASASLGLQAVMSKRVSSHFGATVVLTTLWAEFIGDPHLFKRGYAPSRDHRILAVVAFVLGGIFGRGVLDQIGSAAVFGLGTGMRILIAIGWLFVPSIS
ncbi:hypothetical protein PNOK_0412300 [Pyrrhoderma noxium]|uniref:Uncharacterized protein n=1 Tax=Pyrrhoderma noxium TaxID=2282107 RepID=A0A286UPG8_9AGAM|nr:hypothetical protein PNOK_0412300 [Pyrrhoderma noxium]